LAGVIAHEVGHVQQRHIARMYEHMGRVRLSTIAGAIAAMILATQSSEAAQGAIAATLAGSTQAMINYTREHEKEADYVGIVALSKAGFDPMGMPSFFHRMYQDTRFYGNHIPEYLLTHPLTESRLVAAQTRAKTFPYRQIPDSLQYHLIQARVTVDSFASALEAEQYFAKKIERGNYRHHTGTLYGYVLVMLKQNKIKAAMPYLDELITTEPNQPLFHLAYAEAEAAQNHGQAALNRLEQTLLNHPTNQMVLTKYCELLIRSGQANKVIDMLKAQVLMRRTHPVYWSLLSIAYNQAKLPLQAHLAQSQYLKAQGDYSGAAIQLRVAKKMTGLSAQEKNQIESELKEITKKIGK
jgi:predicted Zn-dependent protease